MNQSNWLYKNTTYDYLILFLIFFIIAKVVGSQNIDSTNAASNPITSGVRKAMANYHTYD